MRYEDMVEGVFVERPNRFIAYVQVDGRQEVCHVKNTGRCRELLVPGARVWCQRAKDPKRKTRFDLIAVQKGPRLINMDSQAPNRAAKDWLAAGGLGAVEQLRSEVVHGDSRFDLAFLRDGKQYYLEVKGVTLEDQGECAFPDAPTERGVKHLKGLARAVQEGFGACVLFVIQMEDACVLRPNDATDPAFGKALREAAAAGVEVMAVRCRVTPDSMEVCGTVAVDLG